MNFIYAIGLFVFIVFCSTNICNGADCSSKEWLNVPKKSPPWSNQYSVPLPAELVKTVVKAKNDKALRLLGKSSVIELNLREAEDLVGLASIMPDRLVLAAYADFKAMAEKKEETAKNPLFSSDMKKSMLDEARRYQDYAAKIKGWSGRVKPYLVRGLVLNEETGNFTVYQIDNNVWVYHASLGEKMPPTKKRPLVLFLNSKPQNVYVGVGMDR